MTDLLSRLSSATGPSRQLDAEIAVANGKYAERQPDVNGSRGYVMARNGDTGPYAIGNVSIVKHEKNSGEHSPEGKARVIKSNRIREITYWIGQRSPNAGLMDDQVREMRYLHATGEWSLTAIGKKFGVSRSCVGRAVARETYADVK